MKKIFSSNNQSIGNKKPAKKFFWKIGLFLIFAGVMMNLNMVSSNIDNSIDKNNDVSLGGVKIMLTTTTRADFGDFRNRIIKAVDNYHSNIEKQADEAEIWNPFLWAMKKMLLAVLSTVHWLVLISASIFDQVIEPDLFNDVIRNNKSVYTAWAMVRDFLNLFFMLALLFSAFSTIFQVEKYHLKKIIILLVVMALLVNFSYPITLFVIDFSNSVMYFFTSLIPHSSATASQSALIAKMTDMGMLTKAILEKADIPALILSIIFQFILFVTLFAFAINLLIRILAFAILLIFSPAGFTLSFFPSTSKLADSWWDSLFKYAVMGPLMIFFLLIANLMFKVTAGQQFNAPTTLNDVGFVGSSLLFTLPIVFLWMGLIASQKFGGAASGSAMAFAKNTGSWVKKHGSKMAYRGVDTVSGHRISGGIGAIKRGWDRMDENYKSKSSAKASKYAEKIGVTGAEEQNMINQAGEYKKRGLGEDVLKNLAINGDAAAAHLLAENKQMDRKTYTEFMSKNKNEKLRDKVNGKVKQTRMDLVAINKSNNSKEIAKIVAIKGWTADRAKRHIISQEMNSLNAEQYAQQNWKAIGEEYEKTIASPVATSVEKREAAAVAVGVRRTFKNMASSGQASVGKNMNSNNVAKLNKTFGVSV